MSTTIAEQPTHPALRSQVNRVPYLPGLDGLRAIAVLGVMVYHANHNWLTGGFLGVEVFFVISGYLITMLLLSERERTGRVSLRAFWARRARRLLPALYTMMVALAVYMTWFRSRPLGQTRGDFVSGVFYVSNWFQVWVGQSYTAVESFAPLRHLWSLAVEEQYYLFWPLVMAFLLRRKGDRLPRLAALLFVCSIAIATVIGMLYVGGSVFHGADAVTSAVTCGAGESHGYVSVLGHCINVDEFLYLSTPTRLGGLMLGASMALMWRPVAVMRGPLRKRGAQIDMLAVLGVVGLVVLMNRRYLLNATTGAYDPWLFRGGFLLVGLCTLVAIAAATHRRTWTGRVLGMRPLRWVGTRSYGLYLYHWPVFQILRTTGHQLTFGQFAAGLAITVPVTELSFRAIERPIREGRYRAAAQGRTSATFRRRRLVSLAVVAAVALTSFAALNIATADVLCVGEIQCDSQKGQQAIGSSGDTPVTMATIATTTTAVSATSISSTTTVAVTTTTENLTLHSPVYAVGESVMLGAAPILQAAGLNVSAAVSRQGRNMVDVVAKLRASHVLGKVVIIQTGTNGPVDDSVFAALMQLLPPDTTPKVVFLTVHAPRSWVPANNMRIRALPAKYPNVQVLDWDKAAAKIQDQLSYADGGIHLATPVAKQFYANLVFDALGRPDLKK